MFLGVYCSDDNRSHGAMTERYQHLMTARPRGAVRLLFREGEYDALPLAAKLGGPWTGTFSGEMVRLKPGYRLAIARDGYVRIEGEGVGFSAEV